MDDKNSLGTADQSSAISIQQTHPITMDYKITQWKGLQIFKFHILETLTEPGRANQSAQWKQQDQNQSKIC